MRQAAGEAEAAGKKRDAPSQEKAPSVQDFGSKADCDKIETLVQPEMAAGFQSEAEKREEARLIRRLQLKINRVMLVIQQDQSLPVEVASAIVADVRRAALTMFPDKTLAFDLIFWPRLQRMMRERYRMQ